MSTMPSRPAPRDIRRAPRSATAPTNASTNPPRTVAATKSARPAPIGRRRSERAATAIAGGRLGRDCREAACPYSSLIHREIAARRLQHHGGQRRWINKVILFIPEFAVFTLDHRQNLRGPLEPRHPVFVATRIDRHACVEDAVDQITPGLEVFDRVSAIVIHDAIAGAGDQRIVELSLIAQADDSRAAEAWRCFQAPRAIAKGAVGLSALLDVFHAFVDALARHGEAAL